MRVVYQRGGYQLVEYERDGRLQRVYLPDDVELDEGVVEQGLPYGDPWENLLDFTVTPEQIADAWRRSGIWTIEDFEQHSGEAISVIVNLLSIDLAALRRRFREYQLRRDGDE